MNEPIINYPISDSRLSFSEYIRGCRAIIKKHRTDLPQNETKANLIIDANSPFELYPKQPIMSGDKLKYGALLIHGLLDCPFSLRDIGTYLQARGILSRAILLPGHGTTPKDLLYVSYHDWIQAVRYGVETLRKEVENIFLIGFSTGAALSIYQALQDSHISGMILLSPAIRIKTPVNLVVGWHNLTKLLTKHKEWLYVKKEIDYTKYGSIPFNPVKQVALLTSVNHELRQHRPLTTPMFMILSREDETVSSYSAINFFSNLPTQENKMMLYTSCDHAFPDPRISPRLIHYPELNITHLAHSAISFTPQNPHYGQYGDYQYASRIDSPEFIYGAYNAIEENIYDALNWFGLAKRRAELTYNPDFDFMADKIFQFILADKHEHNRDNLPPGN